MRRRWLVIFASGSPDGDEPVDATFVDVSASTMLEAMRAARKIGDPPHPWSVSLAYPWPAHAESAEAIAQAHEHRRR
jgi:hypothetical protein